MKRWFERKVHTGLTPVPVTGFGWKKCCERTLGGFRECKRSMIVWMGCGMMSQMWYRSSWIVGKYDSNAMHDASSSSATAPVLLSVVGKPDQYTSTLGVRRKAHVSLFELAHV